MEVEITNLRAQLSRIEQEQKASVQHLQQLEKVSRGIAVGFCATALILIIAGMIFFAHSNPVFPFALFLILTSIPLSLLAQALRRLRGSN